MGDTSSGPNGVPKQFDESWWLDFMFVRFTKQQRMELYVELDNLLHYTFDNCQKRNTHVIDISWLEGMHLFQINSHGNTIVFCASVQKLTRSRISHFKQGAVGRCRRCYNSFVECIAINDSVAIHGTFSKISHSSWLYKYRFLTIDNRVWFQKLECLAWNYRTSVLRPKSDQKRAKEREKDNGSHCNGVMLLKKCIHVPLAQRIYLKAKHVRNLFSLRIGFRG